MTLENAPEYAWVSVMEDLSGLESVESDWRLLSADNLAIKNLLNEMGRTYVGNACQSSGGYGRHFDSRQPWKDNPGSRLPLNIRHTVNWIRQEYGSLEPVSKSQVDELLDNTGCEALVKLAQPASESTGS